MPILNPAMSTTARPVYHRLSTLHALRLHGVLADGRTFKAPSIVVKWVAANAHMDTDAAAMKCTRATVDYATSVGTSPTSVTVFVRGALLNRCHCATMPQPHGPSVSDLIAPAPLHGTVSVASTAAFRAAMAPPVCSTVMRAPHTTSPHATCEGRHVPCDRPLSRPVRRGCTAASAV